MNRWYTHKGSGIYVGWMRGTLVCYNSCSMTVHMVSTSPNRLKEGIITYKRTTPYLLFRHLDIEYFFFLCVCVLWYTHRFDTSIWFLGFWHSKLQIVHLFLFLKLLIQFKPTISSYKSQGWTIFTWFDLRDFIFRFHQYFEKKMCFPSKVSIFILKLNVSDNTTKYFSTQLFKYQKNSKI